MNKYLHDETVLPKIDEKVSTIKSRKSNIIAGLEGYSFMQPNEFGSGHKRELVTVDNTVFNSLQNGKDNQMIIPIAVNPTIGIKPDRTVVFRQQKLIGSR